MHKRCTAVVQFLTLANALNIQMHFDSTNGVLCIHTQHTHSLIHPLAHMHTYHPFEWTKLKIQSKQPKKRRRKMNCKRTSAPKNNQHFSCGRRKKSKALKIEMEIKRSEMCKILLFFLYFVSLSPFAIHSFSYQ